MYNSELDTFLLVAKTGSFSGAAKELYISKNAVMQQINHLEARLDLTLFKRTTHGVILTSAGKVLIVEAKKLRDVSKGINQVLSKYSNTIFVGSGFLNQPYLIKSSWTGFSKNAKDSFIKFVEMSDYEDIPENINLFEGNYSERPFFRQGFEFCKCATSKIVAVLSPDDSLINKSVLNCKDLSNRVITMPDDSLYLSMKKVGEYIQNNIENIQIEKYRLLTTAVVNNSQIQGHVLLIPYSLRSLTDPRLVKEVDWNLSIDYGLYYRKDSNELCQKFIKYICDNLKRPSI